VIGVLSGVTTSGSGAITDTTRKCDQYQCCNYLFDHTRGCRLFWNSCGLCGNG
jgi:hypothetical protein